MFEQDRERERANGVDDLIQTWYKHIGWNVPVVQGLSSPPRVSEEILSVLITSKSVRVCELGIFFSG